MTGERKEAARRAYEAFNRGGIDAILEFCDPDIEWRMWETFSRDERVYRGHEGVREVLGVFVENFDDFQAAPHEFIERGDRVIVPVRLHGKAKGSGEEASFEVVQVWTGPGDGRMIAKRLDVYTSKEDAMRAVEESED
jgi:ketosteroid isomerase-like protein